MDVERGFDWSRLAGEAGAMSLFASRRLIELRLGSSKPGKDGSKALAAYAESPAPGDVLLVSAMKLDKRAQAGSWVKALEKAGVFVQIWPVKTAALPGWLQERAQRLGLQLSEAAAALIAERSEGNLLAGAQELEKLRLLAGEDARIDTQDVVAAMTDSARFDVFELTDTALAGETSRCWRMLQALRQEGLEPPAITWLLTRELQTLVALAEATERGLGQAEAMERCGVWRQRRSLFSAALKRHPRVRLYRLMRQAARLDRTAKGATDADPWQELGWLIAGLASGGFESVQTALLS